MADATKTAPPVPERTWTVPTLKGDAEGNPVPDMEQAFAALNELAVVLMRMGGGASIGTNRVKVPAQGGVPEHYETERFVIRHVSMPAPKPAPAPAPAETEAE